MKRKAAFITLAAVAALALSAGVARATSTLPDTHVKGVTATCDDNNTRVDIHLSDVPAGTEYLVVFVGALQGSPHGTTDGGDIAVNFPGSCKCDQTFTVDVSLDRGPAQLSEDTPFHNVPIKCAPHETTTTTPRSTTTMPTTSTTTPGTESTTTTSPHGSTTSTTSPKGTTTTTAPGRVPPPRSSLPFTGGYTMPLLGLGSVLTAIGFAATRARRRRTA